MSTPPPHHLLIIGGSGRTGKLVIEEALSQGHTVNALVRNTSSLAPQPGLHIIQGSPVNKSDIEKAFAIQKPYAVLTTLNAKRASDNPFAKPIAPPRFMADCLANVRAVMADNGVKRIVIMSAFGVGTSYSNLNFLMRPVVKYSSMAVSFADHGFVEEETKKAGLEWTVVKPAMLREGEKMVVKDLGEDGERAGWLPSVTRESVARFMVVVVEGGEWVGRSVVISN